MDIRDRRISKMPDISNYRDENKLFVTAADIVKKLQSLISSYNGIASTSLTASQRKEYHNLGADFWRYVIGANVIPADTVNKMPKVEWKKYEDNPIPEQVFELWKEQNAFNDGMAIIAGKIWHNDAKRNLYLVLVDLDNQKAIDEFCTRNGVLTPLSELAKTLLVEQHRDQPNKAHVIFYATHPFLKKSSDRTSNDVAEMIDKDQIPAIEVKGAGEHGLLFCSPSPHKNGYNYEIIESGTFQPSIVDDLELHIDSICKKYGILYLDENRNGGEHSSLVPIHDLYKDDTKVYEGHNRHEALLRVMESLLSRNWGILDTEQMRRLANEWNLKHCVPPLDNKEENRQWKDASKFIQQEMVKREALRAREEQRQYRQEIERLEDNEAKLLEEAKVPLPVAELVRLNSGRHYGRGSCPAYQNFTKW